MRATLAYFFALTQFLYEEKFHELQVRANTGLGAEKAVLH